MELEQNPIVGIIEHRGKPCKDFLLLHPYHFEISRNVVEFPREKQLPLVILSTLGRVVCHAPHS